ncbi:portal protein [Caudoviricetes sp.]|nr:portal protein [Caudoviricetes sp.]
MSLKKLTRKLELECPELPWCQTDPKKLGDVITQFTYGIEGYYRRWAQKWFENYQFIYGNQNVKWHRRYDFAVDVDFLRRDNSVNKASQTNISRVVFEGLVSAIYADLPSWEARAIDESSSRSKKREDVTKKLLDYYVYSLNLEDKFKEAACNFVAYGQCAAYIRWDPKAGTMKKVPKMAKIKAPVMTTIMQPSDVGLIETPVQAVDSAGAPAFDERWEYQTDNQGKPVYIDQPSGDIKLEILTPFEYRREPGSKSFDEAKWIQRLRIMDYDDYLREYELVDGKTEFFDRVKPGFHDQNMYQFAMKQFFRMFYTTPANVESNRMYGNPFYYATQQLKYKMLIIEHWDKPNEMWPTGRRVIVANGKATHITMPAFNLPNKQGGWHPFVEMQWLSVSPSSVATGPMNDVASKNREINIADSLISTALLRNMGSALLVKTGSGIDPQRISGTPGEIHEVNDLSGARWLHDEQPISPVVQQLRMQIKDDVYEVSGAQDSLRGDRTKGVSAGYALKQLQEREERRITPARKSFEKFIGTIGEKILTCLRANTIELPEHAMGYILASAAGKFNEDDVLTFFSGLDFGVDVRVEAGSMSVKSKATMQATLMDLAKGPLGQRLAQDASVLDKFLKYFDAETLRDASSVHRDRAQRENTIFIEIIRKGVQDDGSTLPIVVFEDDDVIHMQEHQIAFIENCEEIQKNEILLKNFIIHMERHRLQQAEKEGKQPPGMSQYVPSFAANNNSVPPREQLVQEKQQQQAQQQAPAPTPQPPAPPVAPQQQVGSTKTPAPTTPAVNTPQAKQSQSNVEGNANVQQSRV